MKLSKSGKSESLRDSFGDNGDDSDYNVIAMFYYIETWNQSMQSEVQTVQQEWKVWQFPMIRNSHWELQWDSLKDDWQVLRMAAAEV